MCGKFARPALAALILMSAGQAASAGPTAYVVDSSNNLGSLELDTGAFHPIGVVDLPIEPNGRQTRLFAMGFGADGMLYGVNNRVGDLYRIDPATAATTDLGATGSHALGGGAGPGGALYLVSFGAVSDLYRIDLPAPAASLVGSMGFEGDGSLAYDGLGSFYATGIETGLLHRVDAATGASVVVGALGLPPGSDGVGASVFVGGMLYGFTGEFIGAAAVPMTAAVPEPAGLALLGTALVLGLGMAGRRRSGG